MAGPGGGGEGSETWVRQAYCGMKGLEQVRGRNEDHREREQRRSWFRDTPGVNRAGGK